MRSTLTLLALPLVALTGCTSVADLPAARMGGATLVRADGTPAGTAQVLVAGQRVTLAVVATGVAAGVHGIHLHTVGSCTRPDFTSAGGHLNPLGRQHGSANPAGKHAGDLPNITIQPAGTGSLTADLAGTPEQVRQWLFDADGTAIVLHADPDDYRTDPTGNSGARIACGVIRPA
ncbi:MAG: superoxide dismutase family protein [Cypionkella sp.]